MNREAAMYHSPVMLEASVDGLSVRPDGVYADVTFGGGGHSRAILGRLTSGRLYAFDQDREAERNLPDDDRIVFLNHNFRFMTNFLKLYGALPVDGIIADLGVSSHQFDQPGRGFSIRTDGPLDMRMDLAAGLTASVVVNEYEPQRLAELFRLYGELRHAHQIAALIDRERKRGPVETTGHLMKTLASMAPRAKENKFFAQVFQALRIEVNQELDALKELLEQSVGALKPGGRLVIISYHSLEDRLVKNFMRAGNFSGEVKKDFFGNPVRPFTVTGKSQSPGEAETSVNPRARSARLRVAEKTG
jgi:16S rRNA (cytosine1402-N4)-methyltransferase